MRKTKGQAAAEQQLEELANVIRWLQQIGRWRRLRGEAVMRRTSTSAGTQFRARRKTRGPTQEQVGNRSRATDHGNRA